MLFKDREKIDPYHFLKYSPFMSMIKTKNVIVIEKSNENDFENLSLASKLSICHLLNNIKGK